MNAHATKLFALGPLMCERIDRVENNDGSSTISLKLDPRAQQVLNRAPQMEWVILSRVVYTPYRTPRGDILRLRSLVGGTGSSLPIPNIITTPQLDDIPVASKTGVTLFIMCSPAN